MTNNKSSNISFYVLLAILFTLPLPLGANRAWAWSIFEVAIFLLTSVLLIQGVKRSDLGFSSYKNTVFLWLVLLAICALQVIPLPSFMVAILSPSSFDLFSSVSAQFYFISVDPGQTLISFIKVLSFFCLFICVLCLIDSQRKIRLLLWTIVAAGTVQAIYGSLEVLLGLSKSMVFGLDVTNNASGTFDYSNYYANFLMMSLAAAVGLTITSFEQSNQKYNDTLEQDLESTLLNNTTLVYGCIVILLIGLFMSGSKMGNAAFYLGVVIVGTLALMLMRKPSKKIKKLVINMTILDLFIVSAYLGVGQIKKSLTPTGLSNANPSVIAKDAYPMVADFPILGSGGGSFYSTFPSYQYMEAGAFYNHMQNDYLQFLIEYGVVGCFIMFAIFALSFYKAFESLNSRRSSILKGTAFACAMVFVGMMLHMSVDYPLQAYAIGCYFTVFLALAVVVNHLKLQPVNDPSSTH